MYANACKCFLDGSFSPIVLTYNIIYKDYLKKKFPRFSFSFSFHIKVQSVIFQGTVSQFFFLP